MDTSGSSSPISGNSFDPFPHDGQFALPIGLPPWEPLHPPLDTLDSPDEMDGFFAPGGPAEAGGGQVAGDGGDGGLMGMMGAGGGLLGLAGIGDGVGAGGGAGVLPVAGVELGQHPVPPPIHPLQV